MKTPTLVLLGMSIPMIAADKVKLIIDTDAGFDLDDIHAVATAHYLEK